MGLYSWHGASTYCPLVDKPKTAARSGNPREGGWAEKPRKGTAGSCRELDPGSQTEPQTRKSPEAHGSLEKPVGGVHWHLPGLRASCWVWLTHTFTVPLCFPDSEAPTVHEVRSVHGGGSHPSELHPPAAVFQGPEEKPLLDRASESS